MLEFRFGWVKELPDHRDYTIEDDKTQSIIKPSSLPSQYEIAAYKYIPVLYQGKLGSCTANALASMIMYYYYITKNILFMPSRLFIYRNSRKLIGISGDHGCTIRATIGSLRLFGAPLEEYWPYTDDPAIFDREPDPFVYAYAQNFQAITYHKLDKKGLINLDTLKAIIRSNIPVEFGFSVPDIIKTEYIVKTGYIPYPNSNNKIIGGHAVVAIGWDDNIEVSLPGSKRYTKGAIIFRNSWSKNWGNCGNGYLPYAYFENGLARDFWYVTNMEWVDGLMSFYIKDN